MVYSSAFFLAQNYLSANSFLCPKAKAVFLACRKLAESGEAMLVVNVAYESREIEYVAEVASMDFFMPNQIPSACLTLVTERARVYCADLLLNAAEEEKLKSPEYAAGLLKLESLLGQERNFLSALQKVLSDPVVPPKLFALLSNVQEVLNQKTLYFKKNSGLNVMIQAMKQYLDIYDGEEKRHIQRFISEYLQLDTERRTESGPPKAAPESYPLPDF